MIIDSRYLNQLSSLFNISYIIEFEKRYSKIEYLLRNSGLNILLTPESKIKDVFNLLYNILKSNYRCEYIYKNEITNQILLKKHDLNKSYVLSEFRTGKSIADIVILNDTSSVYEIKTELDSLEKLKYQLDSYKKVFDKIYIVTHERNLDKIQSNIDDYIGLIILSNKTKIEILKEPKSNKKNVSPDIIFDSFRKPEYLYITQREFGYIPDFPNTKIFLECKKLFITLTPEKAHNLMVKALMSRNINENQKYFLNKIPYSLKHLYITKKLSKNSINLFYRNLNFLFNSNFKLKSI
jgi:hypothetical protein